MAVPTASGIPLLADLAVTLTASWQKIFSPNPQVGYWAQHFAYRATQRAGSTANPDQLDAVIRNTFVQPETHGATVLLTRVER